MGKHDVQYNNTKHKLQRFEQGISEGKFDRKLLMSFQRETPPTEVSSGSAVSIHLEPATRSSGSLPSTNKNLRLTRAPIQRFSTMRAFPRVDDYAMVGTFFS